MAQYYSQNGLKLNYDELVTKVISDYDSSDVSGRKEVWDASWAQYIGDLPKKDKPWKNCANLNIPITEMTVDTYHANLMASFFNTKDIVDVKPISANDLLTSEKRKLFLNWQLNNEIIIRPILDKAILNALIFGDTILKLRYVRRVMTDSNGQEVVLYDAPLVDIPNIDEIRVSETATGLQKEENEFIIHKVRMTRSEYIDISKQKDYPKLPIEQGSSNTDFEIFSDLRNLLRDYTNTALQLKDQGNMLTLLEWYGTFYDEDKNSYKEIVAIVHPASKTIVSAFTNELGFRPFVKLTPVPLLNQFYGRTFPQILKYLQAEINTVHNQRIDSASMRIMNPIVYNSGGTFDPQKFPLEPNMAIPVNNTDDVKSLQVPDAAVSQYREEELIWRYLDQLMGINELIRSGSSQGEKTATEIQSANLRGSIRFNLIFSRFETSLLELINQIVRFDQIFMAPEKEFRVVGSDGRYKWDTIKDAEMQGRFDTSLMVSSVSEEQNKVNRANIIYQGLINNPIVASDIRGKYEVTKYWAETIGGKDISIDKVLPRPPQASTRTPQEEHDLLYQGKLVFPNEIEDAQTHLAAHLSETSQMEFLEQTPQEVQELFAMHIDKTKALIAAQQMMQSMGSMQNIGTPPINPGAAAAPQQGQGYMGTNPESLPKG